jgi:hypothetical protein
MQDKLRGQVYTLIAIVVTVPILIFITQYMITSQGTGSRITEKIVSDQIHQTFDIIEKDASKALIIIGKRAVISATNTAIDNGTGISGAQSGLMELMEYGTLDGNYSFIMYNNTLPEWRDKVVALQTHFNVDLDYTGLTLVNLDGFNLEAGIVMNISVSDKTDIAEIERNDYDKKAAVPLVGLEDPLFPLNTQKFGRRTITRHPYAYTAMEMVSGSSGVGNCSGNVSFDSGTPDSSKILVIADGTGISGFAGVVAESGVPSVSCYITGASNAVQLVNSTLQSGYQEVYIDQATLGAWSLPVNEALERGYYFTFATSGPGMFERLENSLSQTSNGLETFINIPELLGLGLSVKPNQVSVDYLYFSSAINTGSQVRGLPTWFRANAEVASRYNLTDLFI